MDDIVKQALAKWPNVPHAWGWLGLDMRGQWWIRDTQAQAQGSFAQSKGRLLEHEKLLAFIARNYEVDAQGWWFFQNGPQRVYVELENTPMVWRLQPGGQVQSHTGVPPAEVSQCWVDEQGHAYLVGDGVLGVVHSADMFQLSMELEQGRWAVQECTWTQLPAQFGFVRSPQQQHEQAGPAAGIST